MDSALSDLLTVLRFPSISTSSERAGDLRQCADWIAAKLTGMGLETKVHPTKRHPVVVAKSKPVPGRPTVLIYGHYDVQPVDPLDQWTTPPFEPVLKEGRIFARGATDNKGQFMAHICGVEETLKEHAALPLNLIFLIEGEEEIGSPNLAPFLQEHRDELKCDIIAISDSGMVGPGVPTFTYGLRGIACVEVHVHGPSIDLHSGIFGGSVGNPNLMLARLLATVHDANGRIQIPGFYDDVRDVQAWEKEAWANLPGESETLKLTGVPKLWGEAGYTDLERRWARPTAEINGMGGGYQGEGSKTVIPRSAFAKFSFRLVPEQDPDDILAKVTAHFEKSAPDCVRVEVKIGHSGKPYAMDPHSSFGKAAQRALGRSFTKDIALIREGGSIPIVQSFKDILGVETLLLGLALPDCQIHAPNENFTVENYEAGIRLNRHLLEEIAAV
jgi:acetylornithine deacetylase/succinyl-diaminopimelate desuccinylase-like protein